MTPGQIFTLNGFSWEQTEEKKRNKMLDALLKVCWDEYGMDKPDECTKKHALLLNLGIPCKKKPAWNKERVFIA